MAQRLTPTLLALLAELRKLNSAIESICEALPEHTGQPVDLSHSSDKLLDPADVRRIFHISESTLYRLKKKNILDPYRIGGRDYYHLSDISYSLRKYRRIDPGAVSQQG